MNNLPPALRPIYTTSEPNQKILLYEGSLEISSYINQHLVQVQGQGRLEYVWFPNPCIKFNFSNQNRDINIISSAHANNLPTSLTLSDTKVSVDVFVESSSSGNKQGNFVSGRIKQAVVQGKDQHLTYVLFHVVNFHNFIGRPPSILKQGLNSKHIERIVFEAEEWKITLDQLETTTDNIKSLNSQGGFAITHVGKLEKLNGQTFTGNEATDFLKIVADFLSFARGFRVPLILFIGYDAEGNKIWQHWNSSVGHSWKYVGSWFPENEAHILADVFPGFLRWWRNWEESEKLALYWYLEANHISLSEQKIILTQVGLESIAYKQGLTRGNASDKLRQLLEKFKTPINLPFVRPSRKTPTFVDAFRPQSPPLVENLILFKEKLKQELEEKLEQETNENNKQKIERELKQLDAPYVFTKVRNDIVHPKKNIENLTGYLYEASDLGLWYLELVLLAIFDYQGNYHNRLPKYQQNGEKEPVPWSNQ
jgi:hypothetical protein